MSAKLAVSLTGLRCALRVCSFLAFSMAVRASFVRRLRSSARRATEQPVPMTRPRRAFKAVLEGMGVGEAMSSAHDRPGSGMNLGESILYASCHVLGSGYEGRRC